jgi:hypothetical protein
MTNNPMSQVLIASIHPLYKRLQLSTASIGRRVDALLAQRRREFVARGTLHTRRRSVLLGRLVHDGTVGSVYLNGCILGAIPVLDETAIPQPVSRPRPTLGRLSGSK